jgi:hypothetical protein
MLRHGQTIRQEAAGMHTNALAVTLYTLAVTAGLALFATGATAQVYRCTTPEGQTIFSDRPCATDAEVHELPKTRPPATPAQAIDSRPQGRAPTQAETEYLQDRERRRQEVQERQQKIREADDRVRQIRADNYDPQKCAEARARIRVYQQRDPIGASYSPDVAEMRQWESLYCGPDQPLVPSRR